MELKSRRGLEIKTWNWNQDVELESRRGIGIKNLELLGIVFQHFREYSIGMKSQPNLEYTPSVRLIGSNSGYPPPIFGQTVQARTSRNVPVLYGMSDRQFLVADNR